MKQSNIASKISRRVILFCTVFIIALSASSATLTFVPSANNGSLYHTSADSRFTWSGPSLSGYCHGRGTIQWFDKAGNITGTYVGEVSYGKNEGLGSQYDGAGNLYYSGSWKNDMKNGFGTVYYPNGAIKYQGQFCNDVFCDLSTLRTAASLIGKTLMDNIFNGGSDLETEVIQAVRSPTGTYYRLWVHFHGNFIYSNEYETTIVLSDQPPYVSLENTNDLAALYLTAVAVNTIAEVVDAAFNND